MDKAPNTLEEALSQIKRLESAIPILKQKGTIRLELPPGHLDDGKNYIEINAEVAKETLEAMKAIFLKSKSMGNR